MTFFVLKYTFVTLSILKGNYVKIFYNFLNLVSSNYCLSLETKADTILLSTKNIIK